MTSAVSEHRTITLAGGALEYFSAGPSEGRVVFYFHGCPGSAREIECWPREALDGSGARVIAVNRPGFGASDFVAGRNLQDFARSIRELAGVLDVPHYDVMGFSAGGPYALACAHTQPEQVKSVTLVASSAPFNAPGTLAGLPEANRAVFDQARDNPSGLEQQLAPQLKDGGDVLALMESVVSDADKAVFARDDFRHNYLRALNECIRQGTGPLVHGLGVAASDWGFSVANIATPVNLWHGLLDRNAPPSMFEYLAGILPDSNPVLLNNQGHYFFVDRVHEILETIKAKEIRYAL